MSFLSRFDFKGSRSRFAFKPLTFHWPRISVTTAWVLLPTLALVTGVTGWLAGKGQDPWSIGIPAGLGLVAVCSSLVVGVLLVLSIARSFVPPFMNRYGIREPARAQKLVFEYIQNPAAKPEFRVVEGVLQDDLSKASQGQAGETHDETRLEFFRRTGVGPATLWVDRESAVLIEYGGDMKRPEAGKLGIRHEGKCILGPEDRLKGVVHLRPQRELVDIKGALTRDTITVDLQVAISYQIRQDKSFLESNQAHHADIEDVRRALLPRSEWRDKTKSQLGAQIKTVLRECEFFQLFLVPPQPPTPSLMATLYTIGQSYLPTVARLELEERVKTRLNETCEKWGVEVTRVSFEQVTPPQELRDAALRAYVAWTRLTEAILQAEKEAQSALRLAQVKQEQVRVERDTQLLKAEGDKGEKVLGAEGDADAYAKRMQARADGALVFARRIETLRQAMGSSLDEKAFQELLRALDLLREEKDEKEGDGVDALAKFLALERYGRNAR
jgi:hypothetical protein